MIDETELPTVDELEQIMRNQQEELSRLLVCAKHLLLAATPPKECPDIWEKTRGEWWRLLPDHLRDQHEKDLVKSMQHTQMARQFV